MQIYMYIIHIQIRSVYFLCMILLQSTYNMYIFRFQSILQFIMLDHVLADGWTKKSKNLKRPPWQELTY